MKIICVLQLLFNAFVWNAIVCISDSEIPHDIGKGVEKLILTKNVPFTLRNAMKSFLGIEDKHQRNAIFCRSCHKVFDQVLIHRRSGANKQSMVDIFKKLCHTFTDWGAEVCNGYVELEIDTALFIMDNNLALTSQRICAVEFQNHGCTDPDSEDWEIAIPQIDHARQHHLHHHTHRNVESQQNFKILHLTDFHYDPMYKPGSNSDCGTPLCCQESSGIPKKESNKAGYWGDLNSCDMPWHSITQVVEEIKTNYSDFDYIYYTGDIISHKSWATNKRFNTESIRVLYQLFYDSFKPIPVIPVLGNHEPNPCDFYSPLNVTETVSTSWVFQLAADEWSRWLPQATRDTILKGGYYTFLLRSGLRIIALNSNVCYTSNLWLIYEDNDPYGQLKWLVEVLSEAERNNEHVHILSHIPPGEPQCYEKWSYNFAKIVDRFARIIVSQFNGHTHLDELRLFYNRTNPFQVVNVAFNGGSFTTYIALNSNFRIYTVDKTKHNVLDYDQYIFNMTEANLHPDRNPRWYKLYSFREAYHMTGMELADFQDLFDRMINDENLVKKYHRYSVKNSDRLMQSGCNEKCVIDAICSIVSVDAKSSIMCENYKKKHHHARVH